MRRSIIAILLLVLALPLLATEPNPSTHQRELIEQLLKAMNADDLERSAMDSMFVQIEAEYLENAEAQGNDADDIDEAKERFALFRKLAAKIDLGGPMHEAQVRMYAKYFTEKELADLVAFYSTPTGKKTIEVMPQLLQEGMQAGAEHLGPQIEAVMAQVEEEIEKKRPWRRTMSDIRTVSTAIEAYAIDNDEEYPNVDYAALKELLVPTYLAKFPEKDIWGHAYAYSVSPDRHSYRLVSAGSDGIFDWDSRRIVVLKDSETHPEVRYRERLEDDFIYADGTFLQLPQQAKKMNGD